MPCHNTCSSAELLPENLPCQTDVKEFHVSNGPVSMLFQALDLMILIGPLQHVVFYNSIALSYAVFREIAFQHRRAMLHFNPNISSYG